VTCEDGTLIEAAVVLDATGHSRRLVKYDKPFNPGYQIAYGIVAEVTNLLYFFENVFAIIAEFGVLSSESSR